LNYENFSENKKRHHHHNTRQSSPVNSTARWKSVNRKKNPMITRNQIKIDVLGQSILIFAIVLLFFLQKEMLWSNVTLIILGIWQIASAYHLYLTYRYIQKINFLRTAIILGVSLPVWMNFVGTWAYLPVVGVLLWYFFWSVRDMIVVYNRPRSFWDL